MSRTRPGHKARDSLSGPLLYTTTSTLRGEMDAAKSGRELRDRDVGGAKSGKKRKAIDAPPAPIKAEPESPGAEVRLRAPRCAGSPVWAPPLVAHRPRFRMLGTSIWAAAARAAASGCLQCFPPP